MPTDPEILGFTNRWYPTAVHTAQQKMLPNGITINLITPACFLATKIEAFDSPGREGHRDMFSSRDFEDIIVVLDGRTSVVEDVLNADHEVCSFLRQRFSDLLKQRYFIQGIEAHLEPDSASQGRATEVLRRLMAISVADS